MKKRIICGLGFLLVLLLAVGSLRETAAFPSREKIAAMTDQQAAEALAGTFREELQEAWGEPDGMLSGLYGDIYNGPDGKQIVVYYDARFDSGPRVQDVHIG